MSNCLATSRAVYSVSIIYLPRSSQGRVPLVFSYFYEESGSQLKTAHSYHNNHHLGFVSNNDFAIFLMVFVAFLLFSL